MGDPIARKIVAKRYDDDEIDFTLAKAQASMAVADLLRPLLTGREVGDWHP